MYITADRLLGTFNSSVLTERRRRLSERKVLIILFLLIFLRASISCARIQISHYIYIYKMNISTSQLSARRESEKEVHCRRLRGAHCRRRRQYYYIFQHQASVAERDRICVLFDSVGWCVSQSHHNGYLFMNVRFM